MPHRIHEYPEVVGKTILKVTVTNESDWRDITVKFTDNTAIHIGIRPYVQMEPEYVDWTTGNGKTFEEITTKEQSIRASVRSQVQRRAITSRSRSKTRILRLANGCQDWG